MALVTEPSAKQWATIGTIGSAKSAPNEIAGATVRITVLTRKPSGGDLSSHLSRRCPPRADSAAALTSEGDVVRNKTWQ